MTAGQALFDEFVRKTRDEGMAKGIEKGMARGAIGSLSRLFARKLGRPLSAAESATVAERYHRLGEDRLDAVMLDLSVAELAAWLAEPEAR